MDAVVDAVNACFTTLYLTIDEIESVSGEVGENMRMVGWTVIELVNNRCIVAKLNKRDRIEEGYYMNREIVMKGAGIGNIYARMDTIDEDNGARFEGMVAYGIPFGFGSLFDENGRLVYQGVLIGNRRMGYGVSFNDNGSVEYAGFWCNSERLGSGVLYSSLGDVIYNGYWYYGDQARGYIGNGSGLNVGVDILNLVNHSIFRGFNVSLFKDLDELIIGDNCFCFVDVFAIDQLRRLRLIKIGMYSFTHLRNASWSHLKANNESRTFYIANCPRLESIDIGVWSFSDYGGLFELKNLPRLTAIKIGEIGCNSHNFFWSSFVLKSVIAIGW